MSSSPARIPAIEALGVKAKDLLKWSGAYPLRCRRISWGLSWKTGNYGCELR
jgi:hypothetical protein